MPDTQNRILGYRAALFSFALICSALLTGCDKFSNPEKAAADKQQQAFICANQLSMFANAKKLWAEQNNKTTNDTPAMADLTAFLRCKTNCPGGGTYALGNVGELPLCSIAEHQAAFLQKIQPPAPATNAP